MCEKPCIRLKSTRTQCSGSPSRPSGSDNPLGDGDGDPADEVTNSVFILVAAMVGALVGGRWLGQALYVTLGAGDVPGGSLFDLANVLVSLTLIVLIYRYVSRHAAGGAPGRAAIITLVVLSSSSPLFGV